MANNKRRFISKTVGLSLGFLGIVGLVLSLVSLLPVNLYNIFITVNALTELLKYELDKNNKEDWWTLSPTATVYSVFLAGSIVSSLIVVILVLATCFRQGVHRSSTRRLPGSQRSTATAAATAPPQTTSSAGPSKAGSDLESHQDKPATSLWTSRVGVLVFVGQIGWALFGKKQENLYVCRRQCRFRWLKKSQAHTCCSSRMHPSSQGPCASRQWSLFWSFGSTTLSSPCSRLSSFAHLSLSFSEHGGVGPDVAIAIPAILLRPPPFPPARKCNTTVRRQHRFWSTCLERVSDDKAENQRKKSFTQVIPILHLVIYTYHTHTFLRTLSHTRKHARTAAFFIRSASLKYIYYIYPCS